MNDSTLALILNILYFLGDDREWAVPRLAQGFDGLVDDSACLVRGSNVYFGEIRGHYVVGTLAKSCKNLEAACFNLAIKKQIDNYGLHGILMALLYLQRSTGLILRD